ncbi:MAG: sugar phosphate nucleotidyltransferase [Oscillospiraceae bacterium]
MKKPILVVMAAGMGSRYGGLKQIDPVGQHGEIIMDFSVFDAIKAGFERVIFIIKKEMEIEFKAIIGDKLAEQVQVDYAFQATNDLPQGFSVPEGRVKPWGTGHAVLAARELIDAPFAAINADDYYGVEAFQKIYDFLATEQNSSKEQLAMVGYNLMNTLSENGHVARGVCQVGEDGYLAGITERTRIEKTVEGAAFTGDDGKTWTPLAPETVVSMNMWGFPLEMLDALKRDFVRFLSDDVPKNPLKSEYFLPFVVNDLLMAGKAEVSVLTSQDKWFGVTYREDKEIVVREIKKLCEKGVYPVPLWK